MLLTAYCARLSIELCLSRVASVLSKQFIENGELLGGNQKEDEEYRK